MDHQSVHFWSKVHIWTVSQSISGRKSIYMDRQSKYFWKRVYIYIYIYIYMDRQSIYFWKTVHIWTVTSRSIFKSSLLSRTFGVETKTCWEHVPGRMNMVTLDILSKQTIFSKWLPRPNHYAHEICIEILCRTPVSILKYLSPRPQIHMKNS